MQFQHSRPSPDGWLFLTSGLPMAVAPGAQIDLGGRKWDTQQMDDGALLLFTATADDNGREQVSKRMDDVAHEVRQRKIEVEALEVQKAKLMAAMEEVLLVYSCGMNVPS